MGNCIRWVWPVARKQYYAIMVTSFSSSAANGESYTRDSRLLSSEKGIRSKHPRQPGIEQSSN